MLSKATIEDIKKHGEWVYKLALNPAKTCYPIYTDGIKTKADFFAAAERAVSGKASEVLLFSMDGKVEGWISYYWIPEDLYLQLDGFYINRGTKQALKELVDLLEVKFHGYTAYFGYPSDNRDAVSFLMEQGFQCIEQAWNHSFFFDSYMPREHSSCVIRILQQNFEKFRFIYHADSETYWNADRIFEVLDDWIVFVYEQPVATIFLTGNAGYYEIYGVEFANNNFQENIFREMLTASLNECKRRDAKYMTYFAKEEESHVLSELGFKGIGQYVLYIKSL